MPVDQCVPGMQVAEEITNRYGGVVLPKMAILNNYYIHWLKQLSINMIKIYALTDEQVLQNQNAFKEE